MKNYQKIAVAGVLTVGIGVGSILFTPTGSNAANNVVLASVDWVTSLVNPINSKLTTLETKLTKQETTIANLQTKINQQQQEINSLKDSNGGSTTPAPTNPALPAKVYVNKSSATIHSGALKSYKVVATKTKGTSLTVIDSFTSAEGLWYRVSLSSTVKGWIHSGDISTSAVNSNPSQVVTTAEVNLRKGATQEYAIVETLAKGVVLTYIQSFKNNSGEVWYNVDTPSGKRGWIISTLGEVK